MKLLTVVMSVLALALGACSSGPSSPPITSSETVCTETFCLDIPDGWSYELGDGYVTAHHDLAPTETFLTAGMISPEAIVVNAGGVWPVSTAEVARSFWTLLEDAGVGKFIRSERVVGGAERSWGKHEDGLMWHLIVPTSGSEAVGVEVRAPNDSWEAQADFVFASVVILSEE